MDPLQSSPVPCNNSLSSDSDSTADKFDNDPVFRSPVLSSPLLFKAGKARRSQEESPLKHVSAALEQDGKENIIINDAIQSDSSIVLVQFSEEAMKSKRSLKLKRRLVSANAIGTIENDPFPAEESLFQEPALPQEVADASIPFAQSVRDVVVSEDEQELPLLANVLDHMEAHSASIPRIHDTENSLGSAETIDFHENGEDDEDDNPTPDKLRKPSGRKRSEMQRETERLLRDVNITLEPKYLKRDMKSFIGRFKNTSGTEQQASISITETVDVTASSVTAITTVTEETQCTTAETSIRNHVDTGYLEATPEVAVENKSQISSKFLLMKEKLENISSDEEMEIMDKSPDDKLSQVLSQKFGISAATSQKRSTNPEKLSWKEFKAKNIKTAKLSEAKKRHKPIADTKVEDKGEATQSEAVQEQEEAPIDKIDNSGEIVFQNQDDENVSKTPLDESDESEAEMTDGSESSDIDYGSGSEQSVAGDKDHSSSDLDQEELMKSEDEDDDDIIIPKKVSRRAQNAVVIDEDQPLASPQQDWSGFQATLAPHNPEPAVEEKSKTLFAMFERIKDLKSKNNISTRISPSPVAVANGESQVPAASFDDTYERSQPAVSPTIPLGALSALSAVVSHKTKLDDDEVSLKSLKFNRDQIQSMDNDSIAETSTVRSYESEPQNLTMSQEERLQLQNERLSMFEEMEEVPTTQYPHTSELDLIDTLNHKNPLHTDGRPRLKRLQRATEIIAEEEEIELKPAEKKVKKLDDSGTRQRIDFVEEEAEVEEDEYMNLGGLDGDQLEAEKILKEELAAFIDEDEETIAKMSIRELEERLMQDESVRKFFNEQLRESDLKETKVLVRDIATGKILERRKHGKTLAKDRIELDKFGRAEDEEEDENAMKELDDADYGFFGDIISKYVAMRKEAQRKKQVQKRKRAVGALDDESTNGASQMNLPDTDEYDWTNENTVGEITIAPGQFIETDMDKLEEKLKNQSIVKRTEERIAAEGEKQSLSEQTSKVSDTLPIVKRKVVCGSPNRKSFFRRDPNSNIANVSAYSSPHPELKHLSADQLRKLSPSSLYRMKQMLGASDNEWKSMNLTTVSGKEKAKFANANTNSDAKRKTSAFTIRGSSGSGTSIPAPPTNTLRKSGTLSKAPEVSKKKRSNVLLNLLGKK